MNKDKNVKLAIFIVSISIFIGITLLILRSLDYLPNNYLDMIGDIMLILFGIIILIYLKVHKMI